MRKVEIFTARLEFNHFAKTAKLQYLSRHPIY